MLCQSIAPHIQRAVIALHRCPAAYRRSPPSFPSETIRTMLLFAATLPNLTSLTVLGMLLYDDPQHSLSSAAIDAVEGSRTLTSLHLDNQWLANFSQLTGLTKSLPFLEDLRLERLGWKETSQGALATGSHETPSYAPLQYLRVLQLGWFDYDPPRFQLLDWLTDQPEMHHLHSFIISSNMYLNSHGRSVARFINKHGRQLQHLHIQVPCMNSRPPYEFIGEPIYAEVCLLAPV